MRLQTIFCRGFAPKEINLEGCHITLSYRWWWCSPGFVWILTSFLFQEQGRSKRKFCNIKLTSATTNILAEGAIARSMTLCGGVLFASWKLLQFPSSCSLVGSLAIFYRAVAQQTQIVPMMWRSAMHCLPGTALHVCSNINNNEYCDAVQTWQLECVAACDKPVAQAGVRSVKR